jgi:hypothetical protein
MSLIHRHAVGELGPKNYADLLDERKVVEVFWSPFREMRRGHSRDRRTAVATELAEVTASNLTHLCSLRTRIETREAYIHLVTIHDCHLDLKRTRRAA